MVSSLIRKKILSDHDYILGRWYLAPVVVFFAFIFWQVNSFVFLLWFFSSAFIFYKKNESKILAGLLLSSLGFCLLFMILIQDGLANIAAIYIYYFLVLFLAQRFTELKKDPKSFDLIESKILLPIKIGPGLKLVREDKEDAIPIPVLVSPKAQEKKNSISITLINILIIVVYLLIFGANLPNEENYFRFLLLAFVLFLVNSVSLFRRDIKGFFTLISKKYDIDQKNIFSVGVINISMVISYFLLYGFSLPNKSNYHRFIVLFFILFIINAIIFLDIKNEEYTD